MTQTKTAKSITESEEFAKMKEQAKTDKEIAILLNGLIEKESNMNCAREYLNNEIKKGNAMIKKIDMWIYDSQYINEPDEFLKAFLGDKLEQYREGKSEEECVNKLYFTLGEQKRLELARVSVAKMWLAMEMENIYKKETSNEWTMRFRRAVKSTYRVVF